MVGIRFSEIMVVMAVVAIGACSLALDHSRQPPWNLKDGVEPIKKSVVTVITYDVDDNVSAIGSGFFIADNGVLLTNFHVLDGAYHAEIKTLDGNRYSVESVLATNRLIDLIKVRVDIPIGRVVPVTLARNKPAVAEPVFVVGSPMGLAHTVSEGIISAIREIPAGGTVLQLTAPISRGSSGGPVVDKDGKVIGVVTFQAARGQNLNFAISIDALDKLVDEASERSLVEWTIQNAKEGPALAAALCSKGSRLTIQGDYQEALAYFKRAAESDPSNPDAWYGLGSCYVGLDRPEDAITAYKRPAEYDPDNAKAHFILAMYYKTIGQFEQTILSLKEVVRIDPTSVRARFELARAYGAMQRTTKQIDTLENILRQQPDHVPTLLDLGTTLGKMGRLDEAMQRLTHASELEPENELIYYNIGVTYNRMHRPEDAIRAYTRAIRANTRMIAAHYNLGMTYLQQGRRKRALDQYEILSGLEADAAKKLFDSIYPETAP